MEKENTELENYAKSHGKKMIYIAILAGVINFVPGILISQRSDAYFNWIVLGLLVTLVSLVFYQRIFTVGKIHLRRIAGLLINLGWFYFAIGLAIVFSAFSKLYFVSWKSGIFNAISAILLIFPMMYFMYIISKKTQVSLVP